MCYPQILKANRYELYSSSEVMHSKVMRGLPFKSFTINILTDFLKSIFAYENSIDIANSHIFYKLKNIEQHTSRSLISETQCTNYCTLHLMSEDARESQKRIHHYWNNLSYYILIRFFLDTARIFAKHKHLVF